MTDILDVWDAGDRPALRKHMTDIEIMRRAAERIADHNVQLRSFLMRLLDPEDLGHAVTPEVREKASGLLSMQRQQDAKAA